VAWSDLAIAALLLLATILVGQAIVSYAIFSGRVLPRADLRRHEAIDHRVDRAD
jgi:hypothetical protein